MATFVIPTLVDQAFYKIRADLTGVEYVIQFQYNQREDSWYMSLFDSLSDPIVQSVKLVVGIPLLRGLVDLRLPAGQLIAIDTEGNDVDPAFADLGTRVLLVYQDAT